LTKKLYRDKVLKGENFMKDEVIIQVREDLARVADTRKKMNKTLGIIWVIGGSLVLVCIITLCVIAFFANPVNQ